MFKGLQKLHLKRILVTDGNIGRHVAQGLAKKGVHVRLLVRRFTPNAGLESLGIEQVECDMSDIDSLAAAFEDMGRFFRSHLMSKIWWSLEPALSRRGSG